MLSTQNITWVFAGVFIVIGLLGFVPGITTDGMLLGIFHVDMMHNAVHLLSGIVAALAALGGGVFITWYFRVFGVVYALVTIMGFVMGGMVLGMMMNLADNLLHLVIAAAALWVGFGMKEKMTMGGMPPSAPSSAQM
jgi:hypothetical protein